MLALRTLISSLVMLAGGIGVVRAQEELPAKVKEALLGDAIYRKLLEEPKDDSILRSAIDETPAGVAESPAFWRDLASNTEYSLDRRSFAIYMLLRRHVRPGMSLPQIGKLFARFTWPDALDIQLMGPMSGPAQPAIWGKGPLFGMRIDSRTTGLIFLAFENPPKGVAFDANVLQEVLHGKAHPELSEVHLNDLKVNCKWFELYR